MRVLAGPALVALLCFGCSHSRSSRVQEPPVERRTKLIRQGDRFCAAIARQRVPESGARVSFSVPLELDLKAPHLHASATPALTPGTPEVGLTLEQADGPVLGLGRNLCARAPEAGDEVLCEPFVDTRLPAGQPLELVLELANQKDEPVETDVRVCVFEPRDVSIAETAAAL